ncbi:hypothetical protein WG922_21375 [Ramlibacter sp. AN1015]|uniref:hypothetical protein n=1 Tax=Ramlibacter sp. AN1015 TaxID=3133428 RepID=UPI0030C2AC8F
MTKFLLKGSKAIRYHGAHSRVPLEIMGKFTLSGPQPVDNDGGVPEAIHAMFEARPGLHRIALSTKDGGGVVWTRIDDEASEAGGSNE